MQADNIVLAPMTHSVQLWLEAQRYWVRIPAGSNVCHRSCEYMYKVFQTVQRPGLCSVVYGTVHCTALQSQKAYL